MAGCCGGGASTSCADNARLLSPPPSFPSALSKSGAPLVTRREAVV